MNTWVFLLIATLYTTSVHTDEYQSSGPLGFHNEYSSSFQDQKAVQSPPRTIFAFSPNGESKEEIRSGHHEDSKYHGPINRPGVLHSRYQATSYEDESSENSQFNTLPLKSQGRHQVHSNDSHENSETYGSASESDTYQNDHQHHSEIQDQISSESVSHATYVRAPKNDRHEDDNNEQRVNMEYHKHRNNPSDHTSFTPKSKDQPFGESAPRGSYILPSYSFDKKQEDINYHGSKNNPVEVETGFVPNPRDLSFDEISPHTTYFHPSHGGSREESLDRDEQQRNLKYQIPTSDSSVPKPTAYPTNYHSNPFDKGSSISNYETHPGDVRHHGSTSSHPAEFHKEMAPNLQKTYEKREPQPMSNYETQSRDVRNHYSKSSHPTKFHKEIEPNLQKKYEKREPQPMSNYETQSGDVRNHYSTGSHPTEFRKEMAPNLQKTYEKREPQPMSNYETQPGDGRNHGSKSSHPAEFHKEMAPNLQKSYEKRKSQTNLDHSTRRDNHEEILNHQEREFKYHNPTSNPAKVAFHSGISSSHDQSSGISTSRATFPRQPYEETPEKYYKNNSSESKFFSSSTNPYMAFHSGHSSNTRIESANVIRPQSNIFHPPQEKSLEENQKGVKYTDHPSLSKSPISGHHGLPSKPTDQSTDESFIRTVVIHPPHRKNYWESHDEGQEDLRYVSTQSPPSSAHVRYQSNGMTDPVQRPHRFTTQTQQPFRERTKASHEIEYKHPTSSSAKILHSSYIERPKVNIGDNDHHPFKNGPLYVENYEDRQNGQLEQFSYQDLSTLPEVYDYNHEGIRVNTEDHIKYHHGDDISSEYVQEHKTLHPGKNRGYESHVSFKNGPASIPQEDHEIRVTNRHNSLPVKNLPYPQRQYSESHNNQDVDDHSVSPVQHHEYSDHVPYNGPYTKPQVLYDRPNTHEFASVTVQPYGTPKVAQPPPELSPISYHHSHSAGDTRPDSHHIQVHSTVEDHPVENQNHHRSTNTQGFSGNSYPQLASHTVYDESTRTPQHQSTLIKTQTENFPVTARPQAYSEYTREEDYQADHYHSEKNKNSETQNESFHNHFYSGPVKSSHNLKDNFNSYTPHNSTRNERFQLKPNPSYSAEGEYINHPDSDNNAYHAVKHHESVSQTSFKHSKPFPQDLHDRHNSSKFDSFRPISNPQTQTSNQPGGSYTNDYSSGRDENSGHYHQEASAYQEPVSKFQSVHQRHNNKSSEHSHVSPRPLKNEGYLEGNDRSYSLGHSEVSRLQEEYDSKATNNAPFTNHQLRQNSPSSNSPLEFPISADPGRNAQASEGQHHGGVHTQTSTPEEYLYPGIHHEYALKFSFKKPKLTPQALPFLSNSNQSEHFAATSAPQMFAGYLDPRNQNPSGPVGYIDNQHGYAPHMSYHALPAVKPIVLQSGYQEDTHEISHAKHDLHVHHSSQSGYQYGIIN